MSQAGLRGDPSPGDRIEEGRVVAFVLVRVQRAELGDKGTFYRALVGPFGSREEAAQVCTSLKAAGGTCLIQGI